MDLIVMDFVIGEDRETQQFVMIMGPHDPSGFQQNKIVCGHDSHQLCMDFESGLHSSHVDQSCGMIH